MLSAAKEARIEKAVREMARRIDWLEASPLYDLFLDFLRTQSRLLKKPLRALVTLNEPAQVIPARGRRPIQWDSLHVSILLEEMRETVNVSQARLARELRWRLSDLRRFESGTADLSMANLILLARHLGFCYYAVTPHDHDKYPPKGNRHHPV